jgi:2,4-dienoyl-CoA reductase-like NADH-dependent reductase (Old Yellow Enzyme family)
MDKQQIMTAAPPSSPHLLSPFDLRGLALRNRVVMAPLTRARAGRERVPNDLMAEYYTQRASAGLIISEATSISEQGLGWLDSPRRKQDGGRS